MIMRKKILSCALINVTAGPQRARHNSKCIRGMKMKSSQSILMFTFIEIVQSESFKNIIKSSLYVHNAQDRDR
jgi:hypothetical protein